MCADSAWSPRKVPLQLLATAIVNRYEFNHSHQPLSIHVPSPVNRGASVTAKLESSLVSLAGAWPSAPLLSSAAPYNPYHHHPSYPLYPSLLLGSAPSPSAGVLQLRSQPAGTLLLANGLTRYQPSPLTAGSGNRFECCVASPPLKALASPISVYRGLKSSGKVPLDTDMALEAVEKRLSVSPSVTSRTTPDNDISSTTTTACTTPVTVVQHHNPGHQHLLHHHHHPLSVGSNSTGLLSPNSTMGSRPNSVTPPPPSMTPPLPLSMSTAPATPMTPVTPSSSSRTTPPSSVTSTSPASVSSHTSHHIAAMGLLLSTSPHSPMSVPRRPDSTSSTSSSASSASSSLDHHHYHPHHRPQHHIFHPHLANHHHQRFHPHLASMAGALGGVLSHHPHHPNTQHHHKDNPGLLGLHDHHNHHHLHHQNNVNRSLKFSIENILRPDFGRVTLKPPSSASRDGGSSNKDTDDEHSSSSGSSSVSQRNHHTGSHRNHHRNSTVSHNATSNSNAKSNSHNHHGHHHHKPVSTNSSSSRPAASATGTSSSSSSSRQRPAPASPAAAAAAATGTAPVAGGAPALPEEDTLPAVGTGKSKDNANMVWPAWVYCTRYSDRPSSGKRPWGANKGPRSRRMKKKDKKPEEKRPRTAFTNEQLARLKKEFQENRYLTEKRRQDLARELQLNESQIKIWFQNKRAKIKKANGQRNGLALHLMAQGLYNHTTSSKDGEMDDNDMMDDDHDDD